jgi:hypothetical protein
VNRPFTTNARRAHDDDYLKRRQSLDLAGFALSSWIFFLKDEMLLAHKYEVVPVNKEGKTGGSVETVSRVSQSKHEARD